MRFRRRSSRGFSRRGTREQLIWARQNTRQVVTTGFGNPVSLSVFTPSGILASATLDERFTIRRLRLQCNWKAVYTAGAQVPFYFVLGVELLGQQEPAADPALAAATDQQADWLAIQACNAFIPSAAAVTIASNDANGITGGQNRLGDIDVRAMRKVNTDQSIVVTLNEKQVDPAVDGAPTRSRLVLDVHASVLFQRTRR